MIVRRCQGEKQRIAHQPTLPFPSPFTLFLFSPRMGGRFTRAQNKSKLGWGEGKQVKWGEMGGLGGQLSLGFQQ